MTAIHSSNFGLNAQPDRDTDQPYDSWFWQTEEQREAGSAFRDQKRNIKLQDKQAEANQKNAMAAAMTAIAQDLQNQPAEQQEAGSNTLLWVVGGVAVLGLAVAGIWYLKNKDKQLEVEAAAR